jgi:hypothetical protein
LCASLAVDSSMYFSLWESRLAWARLFKRTAVIALLVITLSICEDSVPLRSAPLVTSARDLLILPIAAKSFFQGAADAHDHAGL